MDYLSDIIVHTPLWVGALLVCLLIHYVYAALTAISLLCLI